MQNRFYLTSILVIILFSGCEALSIPKPGKTDTEVSSITFTKEYLYLTVGDTVQLSAVIEPASALDKSIEWYTSDSNIAFVDSDGILTAIEEGSCTIKAISSDEDTFDSFELTVDNTIPVISIDFDYDSDNETTYSNIYVCWLENSSGEIQHLYVCERLLPYDSEISTSGWKEITDRASALPFWHLNRFDESDDDLMNNQNLADDVDAVTGATRSKSDFSVSAEVAARLGKEFTLYFEIDESFEGNDWFTSSGMPDQPAVLYSAEIDLTGGTENYTLTPGGFTPMYDYSSYASTLNLTAADRTALTAGTLGFEKGELFEEMRYITHSRTGSSAEDYAFGNVNTAESAIRCIGGIRASISRE